LGGRGGAGGVAYAAHVGGFIAGLALITPFRMGVDQNRWQNGPRGYDRDVDRW
jgi:membrane associated rhomboid family serine protease